MHTKSPCPSCKMASASSGACRGHGTEMGIWCDKAYGVTQVDREERFFAAHLADPSGLGWR